MAIRDWIGELHSMGEPIKAAGWTITPVSRALLIQIPGLTGGLIWNRPAYIRVSGDGEKERILPVRDPTRIALFAIAGLALASIFLARILMRKDNR